MRKLLILLIILTAFTAQARLGETIEEMTKRYGKPISTSKEKLEVHYSFKVGDRKLVASTYKGKCWQVEYLMPEFPSRDFLNSIFKKNTGRSLNLSSDEYNEMRRSPYSTNRVGKDTDYWFCSYTNDEDNKRWLKIRDDDAMNRLLEDEASEGL